MQSPFLLLPGRMFGFVGAMGSGKTFFATEQIFELARYVKPDWIILNYSLDGKWLAKYFGVTSNLHCLKLLMDNRIIVRQIPIVEVINRRDQSTYCDFDYFLGQEENALYCIDEAGVWMSVRKWQSMPISFLNSLAQLRHDRRYIFWIAQSHEQVDYQVRNLTTSYTLCAGFTRYSTRLQGSELMWKYNRLYTASDYEKYGTGKMATSGIKAVIQSFLRSKKTWFAGISDLDRLLFRCYPSFDKVGRQVTLVNPYFRLPPDKFNLGDFNENC